MHKPKNNLVAYILMGILGCLMLYLAVTNTFGTLLMSVVCGFAGVILVACTVVVIWQVYLKGKFESKGGHEDE